LKAQLWLLELGAQCLKAQLWLPELMWMWAQQREELLANCLSTKLGLRELVVVQRLELYLHILRTGLRRLA
jgi:hypothetical protein